MPSTDTLARHVLIVGDPLVMRPGRLTDRIAARLLGASLDRRLAAGSPPESTLLLAARAQYLVSLTSRQAVARNWDRLLRRALRDPAARPMTAAPLCTDQITAAEPAIGVLMARLTTPLPVTARGVALARLPLTDATGPIYNRHSPVALADLLDTAIAHLDPARPLLPVT